MTTKSNHLVDRLIKVAQYSMSISEDETATLEEALKHPMELQEENSKLRRLVKMHHASPLADYGYVARRGSTTGNSAVYTQEEQEYLRLYREVFWE